MDAFGSPTVLHFCFVLLVAAIVSTPRHTMTSLSLCLFIPGLLGLVYTIVVVARMRRQKSYVPVMEDWIWHCISSDCLLCGHHHFDGGLLVSSGPDAVRGRRQRAPAPLCRHPQRVGCSDVDGHESAKNARGRGRRARAASFRGLS